MTRVIRFDAPPQPGSDPRINAYRIDAGIPFRRTTPRVDSKELLALANRVLHGKPGRVELDTIKRRLDEMQKSIPLPTGGSANVPAANGPPKPGATVDADKIRTGRVLGLYRRAAAEAKTPAELLALLEELGATGQLSPAELKALKAKAGASSAKPDQVIDNAAARRRARGDDLAERLASKGRAPLSSLMLTGGDAASKTDAGDPAKSEPVDDSNLPLQERLAAKARRPLGSR